ncbi:aldehyde ferredoxin oxidoreductase [Halogeometricum borinquense]|uniref:Aldehyde ferredoxin oxidoreductase n=1 Tax=Halogeometricum borinquense TaxID=60847 RepID=A0A482TLQ4_9EURY|nr:aldehyde ferredoxin oxidoreductase C-terminal domain-containing protein [Halogeometricum borinquense]RYJ12939.1 aldehyde ferredoxin oxidoreductase [Halogeometricum borinquense]
MSDTALRKRTRLLRVDLSDGTVTHDSLPAEWRRQFVGGKGLAARLLYEKLDPGTDPLSPSNVVILALGPLSGIAPGEDRFAVVTKSPLSGTFLDSYAGGSFPPTLAGALPDHLLVAIEGQADEPTRLVIEDGDARLERSDCWGLDTVETDDRVDGAVACIGPAGENLVRYATLASDGGDHHAGRGGVGAVFGSKQLKSVVARGDPPASTPELESLREAHRERFSREGPGEWLRAGGTLETIDFADEMGVLPTRGWESGSFDGVDDVGIEAVQAAAVAREYDDVSVVSDGRGDFRIEVSDEQKPESVPRGAAPISLGAGLAIDDFDAVATLGATCDRLGVDVISAGTAVAWAMRAADEGLLERDLSFGDAASAQALVSRIARRDGELADTLADGVDVAANRFGNDERRSHTSAQQTPSGDGDSLVPTVKSMALPSYDPRGSPAMALAYATSDRGACHRRARPVVEEVFATEEWSPERRAAAVAEEQITRAVLWSLVVDDFAGEVIRDYGASWLSAVGLDYTPAELRRVGERVWTLTRLFNVREGFDRDDDALPDILTRPQVQGGHDGLDREAFERTLDAYYDRLGWDEDGRPTPDLCERLGIDNLRP